MNEMIILYIYEFMQFIYIHGKNFGNKPKSIELSEFLNLYCQNSIWIEKVLF